MEARIVERNDFNDLSNFAHYIIQLHHESDTNTILMKIAENE